MHSSIQFRHKAISTYTWRRLQSLWLFRSNTLLADSDMCLWFFWGHFCRWKLYLRFHFSLELVYISLSLLQVVCLLQLLSQSPFCHQEPRLPSKIGNNLFSVRQWSFCYSKVAHGVGCVSHARVDMGLSGTSRDFFLLPSFKAGCLGV